MEPRIITLKASHINGLRCYNLKPSVEYAARVQHRTPDDQNKIVYIPNPLYDKLDRLSLQFVAITEMEYNIVA